MTGVLITRPYEKSLEVAKQLEELGYHTFIAPCIQPQAVMFLAPDPSKYKGLIFTSAQAIKTFAPKLNKESDFFNMPALCVGNNTASKATGYCFKHVSSADGNAKDLLDHTIEHNKKTPNDARPYLYVRAYDVAAPLEQWLQENDIKVTGLITYKTTGTDTLPYEVINDLKKGQIQSVLFFSSRTAQNFVNLIRKHRLEDTLKSIKALSISAGVLGCVQELNWALGDSAQNPQKADLYALLDKHCPAKK